MDLVGLPLLGSEDTVEEAIRGMNALDRRAVLVEVLGGGYRLYENADVLRGWRAGVKWLRNLDGGKLVQLMNAFDDIEEVIRDPARTPNSHEALIQALDKADRLFGVMPSQENTGRWIRVVTRHEGLAERVRSPVKVCVCSVNDRHSSSCPPASEGKTCPVCGNPWCCA